MKFKKIFFYHDEYGLPLKEPRVLTPDMVNAKSFEVSVLSGERSNAPQLRVERERGPVDQDPWNDDGRPPTVLFFIEFAHVQMLMGALAVIGFEDPNLVVAGLPRESYEESSQRQPKTPVADLIRKRCHVIGDRFWGPLNPDGPVYPQKVILQ